MKSLLIFPKAMISAGEISILLIPPHSVTPYALLSSSLALNSVHIIMKGSLKPVHVITREGSGCKLQTRQPDRFCTGSNGWNCYKPLFWQLCQRHCPKRPLPPYAKLISPIINGQRTRREDSLHLQYFFFGSGWRCCKRGMMGIRIAAIWELWA